MARIRRKVCRNRKGQFSHCYGGKMRRLHRVRGGSGYHGMQMKARRARKSGKR